MSEVFFRHLRELPAPRIPEGQRFSRVTDSALRSCAKARLGGTSQRVLIALMQHVHQDGRGRLLVSRPSRAIAEVLGMSEPNVRRALSEMCSPEKCAGHPLLRRVASGAIGSCTVYELLLSWALAPGGDGPRGQGRGSASDSKHVGQPPSCPSESDLMRSGFGSDAHQGIGSEAPKEDRKNDEDSHEEGVGLLELFDRKGGRP